ncbi:MAG: M24 family metallopeptidase [Solirubrobacteraceae bacterium]
MSAPRAERLSQLVAAEQLDALLVSDLINLRYVTGFTGTNGLALLGPGIRTFMTDFRYVERAAEEVPDDFDRVRAPQGELAEAVLALLPARRPLRIGFDDAHVTVKGHARLAEQLPGGVELVSAAGIVERLRAVKDPAELERVGEAAKLADAAFAAVVEQGIAGRTEREVALALEDNMRHAGADEPSFPSIVAAGAHGALPHAEPRRQPIPSGTLVVVDWGAKVDGYCSDCTRTVATGPLDDAAEEVYALVKRAQQAALEALRPGPEGREVDAVARKMIEDAGHGERFGHGLGHGVGLEVHEGPRLAKSGAEPLRAGNVVTVEPGVYVPGSFGVRIEDLVALTDHDTRVFSSVSKELMTVG